jgi:hypothetical protein
MENSRERLMNSGEIAAEFGVFTRRWLDLARARGDGPPYIKFGRKCFYRPSIVEQWLNEHTVNVKGEENGKH